MVWREDVDALVSKLEGFLTRAQLAHKVLIAAAQERDSSKCSYWRETTLPSLEGELEAIRRHDLPALKVLDTAFAAYKTAVAAVIDDVRADSKDTLASTLSAAQSGFRQQLASAEAALSDARRSKRRQTVVRWAFGVVMVPLVTAIVISEYNRRRDRPPETTVNLGLSVPCTDADWKNKGNIERSGAVVCHAWNFTAPREAKGYELEASVRRQGTHIIRVHARANDRERSATHMFSAGNAPQPSVSFWLCEVPAGATFRLVAWSMTMAEVRALARVLDDGVAPCSQ
jgi:hypothetical protein